MPFLPELRTDDKIEINHNFGVEKGSVQLMRGVDFSSKEKRLRWGSSGLYAEEGPLVQQLRELFEEKGTVTRSDLMDFFGCPSKSVPERLTEVTHVLNIWEDDKGETYGLL